MTKQDPISFFIPAYNCESTISESIESIMSTNFEVGDELIIVNDCSTDNTAKILAEYLTRYPSIRIIHHRHNKGGAATRNTAIENAQNELLFCLDSDNILAPNSIKALKSYLLKENADVAVFQHLKYFSEGIHKIDKVWTLPEGVFPKEKALTQSYTPGSGGNYLFTKKSWLTSGGYPEFAGALDTWGFGLRQLLNGFKTVILKDSFYYHRLLENSYYLRDAWNRQKSVSLRATQLLIPFFDYISDKDIDYIMSTKHRYHWFDTLENRPLHIIQKQKNLIWASEEFTQSLLSQIKSKIKLW